MTPSFVRVFVDGQNVQELAPFLLMLDCTVTRELNQHSTCAVQFREPPGSRFFFESTIGKPMKVEVTNEGGGIFAVLFAGLVQQVDADWELNGSAVLTLSGISESFTLDTFNRSQTFRALNFLDASKRLRGKFGGAFFGVDTPKMNMLQFNETDWSFLRRLADRFGCFLQLLNDGEIEIHKEFVDTGLSVAWRTENGLGKFRSTGRMTPQLVFGVNFESTTATSKEVNEIGDVPAESSIPALRSGAADGSVSVGLTSGLWNRFLVGTHDGFEQQANFESQRQIINQCRAIGESRFPDIEVGKKVEVTGNPDVDGKYGVIKIVHRWTPTEGYRNQFECTPFTKYMEPTAPPVERYYGPEIARVVETSPSAGPRGVQVRVAFQWEEENETNFIPLATPNSGADRGICFVPEVGDEVMVFFRGGDSCKPFVLGSLWNGVDLPPLEDLHGGEYSSNDLKRIVTKSGNRLVFDDKPGSETMVMATPNHVRVSLFDGGQTLVLHSDGDVHINAGGTVHMKCKQFLREVG
jgi:phage baseplate assembly protein gpV